MSNAYKIGKHKLTAMQYVTYNYIKNNKEAKSIEEMVQWVYKDSFNGKIPDIWSDQTKIENVTKWCTALIHLKLIKESDGKYYI